LGRDKDIIGAIYNRKTMPITPMLNIEKEKLPNYPFKINAMPTGLLLIKTEVFKKMQPPWFAFRFVDNSLDWMGEDIYFCGKAAEYKFEIWCDPTIEVKHIGDYTY
jgi:hypothetical protein